MASKKPLESSDSYAVFRKLLDTGKSWNLSEANSEWRFNRNKIQRGRDNLKELGIIKIEKGKYGSKNFEVNPEGLEELFCTIWEIDQGKTSDRFQEFLMNWVRAYDKGDSSIRRMLREDFAEAVNEYRRDNNAEYPEGLKFLEKAGKMEGYLPVKTYLDKALRETFGDDVS